MTIIAEPTTNEAIRFYLDLQRCDGMDDCAREFKRFIRGFGFAGYAAGEVDIDDRDRTVFYILDWPAEWMDFYVKSGFLDRDPLVEALRRYQRPFTWSELRRERKLSDAGSEALRLLALQGWTEGLAVPVPRGGSLYGLVSLAGRCAPLGEEDKALVCLVSGYFLSHIRALGPPAGYPLPPAGLTGRELECLRLVAAGSSDREMAQRLGVAVSTAHEYADGARKKLKAQSRAQMVAVASALGMIDASDDLGE